MVCRPHRGVIMGLAGYESPRLATTYRPMAEKPLYSGIAMERPETMELVNQRRNGITVSVDQMLYGTGMRTATSSVRQYAPVSYFSSARQTEVPMQYIGLTYQSLPTTGVIAQVPQTIVRPSLEEALQQEIPIIIDTTPKRIPESPVLELDDKLLYEPAENYSSKEEPEELHRKQKTLARKILDELKELESPGELALSAVELLL